MCQRRSTKSVNKGSDSIKGVFIYTNHESTDELPFGDSYKSQERNVSKEERL